MPEPKPNEKQEDWMKRCIPVLTGEGMDQDQATAVCLAKWSEGKNDDGFFVEVMSVGTWNNIKFTVDDLTQMVKNFDKLKDIIKPPVKLGHTKDKVGEPALGWITKLKLEGQKLLAYVQDIPEVLRKAIDKKLYRRVSSEIFFDFKYNNINYGKVFSALAFLGAELPAVKNLEDIQAYLTENALSGTFQKVVFEYDAQGNHIIDLQDEPNKEATMPEDLKKQFDELSAKLVSLTEENTKLLKVKEEAEAAKAELQKQVLAGKKTAAFTELKTWCDSMVEKFKMIPAQRDALLKDQVVCFTENCEMNISMESFKAFVELGNKVLGEEEAADSGTPAKETFADVQTEMDNQVRKFMSEKKIDSYSEAFGLVCDENPDLAQRYNNA